MNMDLECSWRQPMWANLMRDLPASITINLKTRSYVVRDNTLQIIYADDLYESDIDILIEEIAEELHPRSRIDFINSFSTRTIIKAWNDDKKGYMLLSRMKSSEKKVIRTELVFEQSVRELIFELRFDIF
jgi:hypothetical protein